MVYATLVLVALVFLATFFIYFPNRKLLAWLQQSFSPIIQTPLKSTPTVKKKPAFRSSEMTSAKKKDALELKQVFATFDKNNDGFITKQELKESLKNIRVFMSDEEVDEMVNKVDANGDGLVDFKEFCFLFKTQSLLVGNEEELEEGGGNDEVELKEAFEVFDKDKNGLISAEELGVVLSSLGLREGNRVEACTEMVKKVNRDGDGLVNFDEFKMMMMKGGGRLLTAF